MTYANPQCTSTPRLESPLRLRSRHQREKLRQCENRPETERDRRNLRLMLRACGLQTDSKGIFRRWFR